MKVTTFSDSTLRILMFLALGGRSGIRDQKAQNLSAMPRAAEAVDIHGQPGSNS